MPQNLKFQCLRSLHLCVHCCVPVSPSVFASAASDSLLLVTTAVAGPGSALIHPSLLLSWPFTSANHYVHWKCQFSVCGEVKEKWILALCREDSKIPRGILFGFQDRAECNKRLSHFTHKLFSLWLEHTFPFFNDFYFFHHSWFTVFCQFLLYSKVTQSLSLSHTHHPYTFFWNKHFPWTCHNEIKTRTITSFWWGHAALLYT